MRKVAWSDEAALNLGKTTDDIALLRTRVETGDAEVWRVGNSWLVTELFPDLLWVWCFQGRDFLPVAQSLSDIALRNGLHQIGWFTFHYRLARRMFRHCTAVVEMTNVPGEYSFTLKCEEVCAARKTLAEASPSVRSAGTTLISDARTAAV